MESCKCFRCDSIEFLLFLIKGVTGIKFSLAFNDRFPSKPKLAQNFPNAVKSDFGRNLRSTVSRITSSRSKRLPANLYELETT